VKSGRQILRSYSTFTFRPKSSPAFPSPREAFTRQRKFTARLEEIWEASKPVPFPLTYDDFRRAVIDQILKRLRKEDPRYRRPRF